MAERSSVLSGPPIVPEFRRALNGLVGVAHRGQQPSSEFFNPPDDWLIDRMRIFQDLPAEKQRAILEEATLLSQEAQEAQAAGRAAKRVWPDVAFRLDNGGLAFFSQLGVVRRPDLTKYFVDGFDRNRDALALDEAEQALLAAVLDCITSAMERHFAAGDGVIQTDRQISDAPGRSYHARQLLFGTSYLQVPYMWRQLTFDLPERDQARTPDIVELSIPRWLDDLEMPEHLVARLREAGLTQLVLKAPTKGLSLHLGFDYVGEHKMGPLSIAMFLVKERNGLAVQAAASMARVRTLDGRMTNTAVLTVGPSLHGKSTLTIMIELANSDLAGLLGLAHDPDEGVYPMNDDIILLQPLPERIDASEDGYHLGIPYGIDGTENSFYAVPFGLTREDDPITYDVLRGTSDSPNEQETLENVPVNPEEGTPDYLNNPVRNMRMILSRPRLLDTKGAKHLLGTITNGTLNDSVHVPMEFTDRVFWQAVMRQNTVVPPLRRLTMEQYVRVLMYGEAVEMGAAAGAIGRPYVEYFSDPFIIGLEDENANLMYHILQQLERGGLRQEYYVFNTGGVGADSNEQASGRTYKKIPRELTLMLQEALLRGAVRFEYDPVMVAGVAVSISNQRGDEVMDLRAEWLPREIYGQLEYRRRVDELSRRRYYGRDSHDRAGILRYTKVTDALLDLAVIPPPRNERELSWLLSFYWHVDQACESLAELRQHRQEGRRPAPHLLRAIAQMCRSGQELGLTLPAESESALRDLGVVLPARA